ncbi:ATP-binding protein [Streptosporangium sp. NPDC023963]|uniref:ATP-binding protein n=1 Tax=Streptosporangium sp. NPDC023963 TaxID=3155608 RepID=UPI00343B8F3D
MRPFVALALTLSLCAIAVPLPRPSARRASWPLPPIPASVPRARRLICGQLAEWGIGEQGEIARLLVSELVTNALRHAWGPIRLAVSYQEGMLRCEVDDANPALPYVRDAHEDDEGGRGLYLLDLLSARWGSERTSLGKVSWFELAIHPRFNGTAA